MGVRYLSITKESDPGWLQVGGEGGGAEDGEALGGDGLDGDALEEMGMRALRAEGGEEALGFQARQDLGDDAAGEKDAALRHHVERVVTRHTRDAFDEEVERRAARGVVA